MLILEDDPLLAKYLVRLFSGRGYDVQRVGTLRDFRAEVPRRRFDALLLDLRLPDGDGLQAWADARASQPGSVAILMTAHGTPEVAGRAAGLGMHGLLVKPLDIPRLLSTVQDALAQAGAR
jgi:DNA-binding NtrC family response regulator